MNSTVRAPQPVPQSGNFELELEIGDFEIIEEAVDLLSADDELSSWDERLPAQSVHEAILRFLDEKF